MQIKRERLTLNVPSGAEQSIWEALGTDFGQGLHGAKKAYWTGLSLPTAGVSYIDRGDVFVHPDGMLMYYLVPSHRNYIEAGCVRHEHDVRNLFDEFRGRIQAQVAAVGGGTLQWSPLVEDGNLLDMLAEEARRLEPGGDQLAGATLLGDVQARTMLRQIQSLQSCSLDTLAQTSSLMEAGQIVGQLEAAGLVGREFAVYCRDNGSQISRVPNFNEIEEATARGFKCFSCGRPIAQERIDQVLSCTASGQALARPDQWLALLVGQQLLRLGASEQGLYSTDDKQHLDLFGCVEGSLVMCEVREEACSLRDAYLFAQRVRYYSPSLALFVSTAPLAGDVQRFLQSQIPEILHIVTDLNQLSSAIEHGLSWLRERSLQRVAQQIEESTRTAVHDLVYQYFFAAESSPSHQGTGALAPSRVGAGSRAQSPAESPLLQAVTAAAVSEATDTAADHAWTEPALTGSDSALEDEAFVSEGLALSEESLPPEWNLDEVVPMEPLEPDPRPLSETRQQVIKRVLDGLGPALASGSGSAMENLVSEIATVRRHSAGLVDTSGTLLVQQFASKLDAEQLAAVSAEALEATQRTLDELDCGTISTMHIESHADRLHLYRAASSCILSVYEERTPQDLDEDVVPGSLDEFTLRDAMLNKVLETLGTVQGVRGSLVTGRDGLLIDMQMDDSEFPPEVLGSLLSQALVDLEKLIQRLGLSQVRQILIDCGSQRYSLIPIDKEGILVTQIDPSTSREVWQGRLYQAASMLVSVFH